MGRPKKIFPHNRCRLCRSRDLITTEDSRLLMSHVIGTMTKCLSCHLITAFIPDLSFFSRRKGNQQDVEEIAKVQRYVDEILAKSLSNTRVKLWRKSHRDKSYYRSKKMIRGRSAWD